MPATLTSTLLLTLSIPVLTFPLNPSTNFPIPSESNIYNNYTGLAPPLLSNLTGAIPPSASGPPGPDDLLFQNLLSAEWIIYAFYQYGVSTYNTTSFTDLGLPTNTWERIAEIRDNEAGHVRIFQGSISATSTKPGICRYDFATLLPTAKDYLVALSELEIGSMVFVTALVREAKLNSTKSALAAVGETESRHESWALSGVYGVDPFAGPVDTVFPYANQVLETLKVFVVPGSCPDANPPFPSPSQGLPQMVLAKDVKSTEPGSEITVDFFSGQPVFDAECQYHAVFFHGVENVTVPFNTKTNSTTVPSVFESGKGAIELVIADAPGAPTQESVVAGPLLILEQPTQLANGASQ